MKVKQAILGTALMAFGSLVLVAVAISPSNPSSVNQAPNASDADASTVDALNKKTDFITADIDTEARLLAAKKQEREAAVRQIEAQTKALLQAQDAARTQALEKSSQEQALYEKGRMARLNAKDGQEHKADIKTHAQDHAKHSINSDDDSAKTNAMASRSTQDLGAKKSTHDTTSDANIQNKSVDNANIKDIKDNVKKNPSQHLVSTGDTLIGLSKQYGIAVSILAEANNMARNGALQRGKYITIPSKSQIAALQDRIDKKQKKQAIEQKLHEVRKKTSGDEGRFGVQIALAQNQAKADALAQNLKQKGYTVQTTPERRGVRVVVGQERSKEAALLLKDKLGYDDGIQAGGAWVRALD